MIKWSKVSPLISHCRETPPLLTRAIEYTPSCMTVGWQEKIFLVHGTDFKIFHVIFNWKYCLDWILCFFLHLIELIISRKLCIYVFMGCHSLIKWGSKEGAVRKKTHISTGGGGVDIEVSLIYYFWTSF